MAREKIIALGKKMTDRIPYKLGLEKLTEDFFAPSVVFHGHTAAIRCFPAYRKAAAGFVVYRFIVVPYRGRTVSVLP